MRAIVARVLAWLTFVVVAFGAPSAAILWFDATTATALSTALGGLIGGATLALVVDYYVGGKAGASAPTQPAAQRPPDHGPYCISTRE